MKVLGIAILAPIVLIGVANALFAPKPRDAEMIRCDLLGVDSESPRVEAAIWNRTAGWLSETFRVRVVVEGLGEPIVSASPLQTIWRGATAIAVVPLPPMPAGVETQPIVDCLLFAGENAEAVDSPVIDPLKAIDRRRQRSSGQWDVTRRIVFISGMGTDTVTALGTFDQMADRFSRLLGVSTESAFVHFSYAGKYQLPASAVDRPLRDFRDDAPVAEFVAADVCVGAASASQQLRTLLKRASPVTEFVIIGHSFGGFVASHFLASLLLEDPEGSLARRIHSVTTLDSPIAGYPYAPIAGADNLQASLMSRAMGCGDNSQAAKDVIRGSDALGRIATLASTPSRTHFVSISNAYDVIVPAAVAHGSWGEMYPLDSLCMDLLFHGCVLRDPGLIARLAEVAQRPWVEREGDDDHGDDLEDATPGVWEAVETGARQIFQSGRLERSGDRDLFRLSVRAGRSYLLFLVGYTNVDAQLSLRDELGTELEATDHAVTAPAIALTTFIGTYDGDLFVQVTTSRSRPSATGPYELFAEERPPPE